MTPLGGRSAASSLRDFAADAHGALAHVTRRLLDPKSRPLREKLLASFFLLLWLVPAVFISRALTARALPAGAMACLALSITFGICGVLGWRRRRGSERGRALLVMGGAGAVAWIVLARDLAGGPMSGLWRIAWFALAPALAEAGLQATRGEGQRGIGRPLRAMLYAAAPALWLASRTAAPADATLAPALRDLIVAGLLLAAAEGLALAAAVAGFRARRAIERRQRGKLLAPAHVAALLGMALAAVLREGAIAGWAIPLLLVVAPSLAITAGETLADLLWVDPFLRRGALVAIALPLAILAGALAARAGGGAGIAAVTALLLAAPAAWSQLVRLAARIAGREARRRDRAIARLRVEVEGPLTAAEIAMAARTALGEAFPGVDVAVLAEDTATGSLREVQSEPGACTRPPLQPDHPLQVFFRTEDRPLSRYEVLVSPRFAGAREPLLREMDELRAAALIPCRERQVLRGILLLGAQARGGFFTGEELASAGRAGAVLAEALSRSLLLGGASSRIADLERALDEARREMERAREEAGRAGEDLEESTRHVMQAYQELKTRGTDAKQARAMLAMCATPVLAGRVASRTADRIASALDAARPWIGETHPRWRAPKLAEAQARVGEAALCARALDAISRSDLAAPSDLGALLDQALAVMGHGRGDRIRLETKLEEVPPVLWPRGALLSALLHLLFNAEESIPEKGTIGIDVRLVPGRPLTLADAEAGNGMAPGASEGKRAFAAGAHRLEIAIRDDGEGIAPEHLSSLFDPFFTTRRAAGRPGGALGLGLTVVADALARHGGSVRVDSTPGEGSAFILELPAAEPAPRKTSHARR